jgi:hypothetical protein
MFPSVIPLYEADCSRVTHPSAARLDPVQVPNPTPLDLHVLGTPPAFVLSQDQTLQFNLVLLKRFAFASALLSLSELTSFLLPLHCSVFKDLCRPPMERPLYISKFICFCQQPFFPLPRLRDRRLTSSPGFPSARLPLTAFSGPANSDSLNILS